MGRRFVSLFATLGVLAGCSHTHSAGADTAPAPDEGWTLTVINHHWLDVSVYVISDGGRSHIALVAATQTESFELPARMITGGRLIIVEANPIGANRTVRTERLAVQGGQRVEWTLETGLERSTVAVY